MTDIIHFTARCSRRSRFAVPLLLILPCTVLGAESAEPVSLAERAIAAKYEAESLNFEKDLAARTVAGAKRNIETAEKSLPDLKTAVEKLAEEKRLAADNFAKSEAEAKDARTKAEASGNPAEKASAEKAEHERLAAERLFRTADANHQREAERLQRTEQQLKDRQTEMDAASQSIPKNEAAAKVATERAVALRVQAREAIVERMAAQNPHAVARQIDGFIDARLKQAGIAPSPAADDAEFLRRVTLDVTGAIPSYEDVLAWLDETSPDKRTALIDRLLAHDWYGRNFAQRFCTLTTENGTTTLLQGQDYFNNWLAESLNLNRGWDRVVTDMLAADGYGYREPGVLFSIAYRMNEQPDPALLVAAAGDYFLGLQIKCAQCHDHPFFEWKQNEFWSRAALFGRVRLKGNSQNGRELEYLLTDDDVDPRELVRMNGVKYPDQLTGGRIAIPDPVDPDKTLGTVSAAFLDGKSPSLAAEKGNFRENFASWVTSKDNPYFARATVNRLWAHFFGRGLVADIENLHPQNEPSHPEVLDLLAAEFRNSNYDLQYIIRCIVHTAAYGRTSRPVAGNETDEQFLSHMAVKPLDSFALVDSLWVALRRTPPDGTRRREAAAVFDTRLPGGDPTRYTHSIPQVLKLMNTSDHLGTSSPTVQLVTRDKPAGEAIAHLYLAVLGRRPSPEEAGEMLAYLNELGDSRQAQADIFWVLLNSAEFAVNH